MLPNPDMPIGIKKGDCHGAPPVAVMVRGQVCFGWPATDADDWCKEFTPKEESGK